MNGAPSLGYAPGPYVAFGHYPDALAKRPVLGPPTTTLSEIATEYLSAVLKRPADLGHQRYSPPYGR